MCGNKIYQGFGYINFDLNENLNIDDLKSCVKKYHDNRDVQQIIRAYVKRNKSVKIIDF